MSKKQNILQCEHDRLVSTWSEGRTTVKVTVENEHCDVLGIVTIYSDRLNEDQLAKLVGDVLRTAAMMIK